MLVVEPDYIPDSKVCLSHAWTSFPNRGVGGGLAPHNCRQGGLGGATTIFVAPPSRVFVGSAPEVIHWEKLPCKIL
jgi:hypothetical protein